MKNYKRLIIESQLRKQGHQLICGVDEVGMSNLAGGFVIGALILDLDKPYIININDSKQLSWKHRRTLEPIIKNRTVDYSLVYVEPKEINEAYNNSGGKAGSFRKLHLQAMTNAVMNLKYEPDFVISDYYELPNLPIPQRAIQGGDRKSATIGGASILAKCHRERIMEKLADNYFNFSHWKNTYGNWCPQEAVALHLFNKTDQHRIDFIDKLLSGEVGLCYRQKDKFIMKRCPKRKCSKNKPCSYLKYFKKFNVAGIKFVCPNEKYYGLSYSKV